MATIVARRKWGKILIVMISFLGVGGGCGQTLGKRDSIATTGTTNNTGVTDNTGVTESIHSSKLTGGHTVAVIDGGFDLTDPVLASKVLATYTINCADSQESGSIQMPTTLAEFKAELITSLGSTETDCTLSEGLTLDKSPDLATIANYHDSWNKAIEQKLDISTVGLTEILANKIHDILEGIDSSGKESYSYHGTATAGLIAYQNPDVRLVLIQDNTLLSSSVTSTESQAAETVECPDPTLFALTLQAYADPEVQNAYISAPMVDIDAAVDGVLRKHQVTLVNFSAGPSTRSEIEASYRNAGCKTVDLKSMDQMMGSLTTQQAEYRKQHDMSYQVLTLQAAGNSSVQIDSWADTEACHDPQHNLLLVGAYDYQGIRSSFSNYGDCVDLYGLGSDVVVAAPNDFVNVEDGTSFSTPLAVRYASMNISPALSPDEMTVALLAARNAGTKFLPPNSWPTELAYDADNPIASYSLIGGFKTKQWNKPRKITNSNKIISKIPLPF